MVLFCLMSAHRREFAAVHARDVDANVPHSDIAARAGELPRDRPILAICASGNRSQIAADTLRGLGFARVSDIEGGTKAWQAAGLPTTVVRKVMPLDQQFRLIVGGFVLSFTLLGAFVSHWFLLASGFVGFMLGVTALLGICPMLKRPPQNALEPYLQKLNERSNTSCKGSAMWHDTAPEVLPFLLTGVLGLLTGFLLGSLGAGGSLLALPAFLYAARLPVPVAVATSLVVVGLTSILGGIFAQARCRRRGCPGAEVSGWVALVMAVCGLLGTQVGVHVASLLTPAVQQGLFVIVLLGAATALLRNASMSEKSEESTPNRSGFSASDKLQSAGAALPGFGVGILTGVLGVGGGFLLVPALRLATGLSVRRAAATSLWVIAANAGFALVAYLQRGTAVAWVSADVFLLFSLPGMLTGQRVVQGMRSANLQRGFATLLGSVAVWTLWVLIRPFFRA